jgi:GT2 family glycosyltransferase
MPPLLSLWQQADGRELTEIERGFHADGVTPIATRTALACLAEAGLLIRDTETRARETTSSVVGDAVSVIIVTYNSTSWLESCLASLTSQTCPPLEIIVVDNASSDYSADWVATHFPDVKLVRLTQQQSLAHAINRGVAIACGDYFLILNPDVNLMPDAIAQMVAVARAEPMCAAVAPKLYFSWAPGFLNGIGNHVGAFSWATDNGLGHLDLGQFDVWREVPSACFAVALVPRAAWEKVGALDEGLPLYYEDLEWCYRARLFGYTIRAAPHAIIYHVFGARVPSGDERGMSPQKLRNVVYGRLHFAIKLLRPLFLARFVLAYGIEDCCRFLFALLRLDARTIRAYCGAWYDLSARITRAATSAQSDSSAARANRPRTLRFAAENSRTANLAWLARVDLGSHTESLFAADSCRRDAPTYRVR